jgi:putative ABC transport system permease protein
MLAIGAGAERRALALIESLGLRNVLVRAKDLPEAELVEVREKSLGVSPRDAAAIEEAVGGVVVAAPRLRIEVPRVYAAASSDGFAVDGRAEAQVWGVSWRHAALAGLTLAEGRFLDARDEAEHAQVAVLGGDVRRALFGFGPAVGHDFKAGDVWLRVVGVLAGGGPGAAAVQGVALGSPAREIYLPISTARRKFEHDPLAAPLSEIVVHLAPGTPARAAAAQIEALLVRLHAGAADYELIVPEALLAQSRRTQRLFNAVMGAIAGISLLVGGIGIMNILLATVLERTREIGVRRAVGARARDIRWQFLIEAFAISLLGGLAGIVAGIALAGAVAAWAEWPTVVTAASVLLATGVALAVGLASGYYPASRAARLDPVEALRYE